MALTPPTDKITLIVFRENLSSRVFQIPSRWIPQFGFGIGLLIVGFLTSVGASIHFSRLAGRSNQVHVQDLEKELQELRHQVKHPPTETTRSEMKPKAFYLFPPEVEKISENPEEASLTLTALSTQLVTSGKEKRLKVHFALQYQKSSSGSQQGRIFILARAEGKFWVYPSDALHSSSIPQTLLLEKGESFSVSRYREVTAEFGPLLTSDEIDQLEIFIVSKEGTLLIYHPHSLEASP